MPRNVLQILGGIFGAFDLAASVETAGRTSHQLHVLVVALAKLQFADNVLDVLKPVGLDKL